MDILSSIEIITLMAGIIVGFFIRKILAERDLISKEQLKTIQEDYHKILTEKAYLSKDCERIKTELHQQLQAYKNAQNQIHNLGINNARLENQCKNFQNENVCLQQTNNVLDEENRSHRTSIIELNEEKAKLIAQLDSTDKRKKELDEELQQCKQQLKDNLAELSKVQIEANRFKDEKINLEKRLIEQRQEMDKLGEKFTDQFKVLSSQILEEKSQRFTEQNQENLKKILEPLEKDIHNFKLKVEEAYINEAQQRFSLGEKIKELVALNNKISEEATNLTNALKGSVKKQGDWGEMILENILENSGLRKGQEYMIQEFIKDKSGTILLDENGKRLQPDVIINCPGERKIIIDSKVSLLAYERYSSATDNATQCEALKEHVKSIKKHIDGLSEKSYHKYANSLDFVMLFIPIEPAYFICMQSDQTLWDYAYKNRIVLISPTNLIAAVKLISDLWSREYQNQNALEIADRGGKLYDKLKGFVESVENIGKHLDKSKESYDKAIKQLSTGNGNLISQAEMLRQLGVNARKAIPERLIQN